MIKVAALTAGRKDPCARYRVRQYLEPLHANGIEVCESWPRLYKYNEFQPPKQPFTSAYRSAKLMTCLPLVAQSWAGEITWLQREMYHARYSLEGLLKRPLVFDVDDAIWLEGPLAPQAIAKIARIAEVVLAGNVYLANWFSQYAQKIEIIPTAVDCERFKPVSPAIRRNPSEGDFVLGWIGTHWNLPFLQMLDKPLSEFVRLHSNSKLLVVSNQQPAFEHLPAENVEFIPWSPEVEVEAIQRMNVGLMPLPDDEWARGKCSFKMLQYMACGIPVIVSPVGMNADVLAVEEVGIGASTQAEWFEAFRALIADPILAETYGQNGRQVVLNMFSRDVVAAQLTNVFRALN